MVEPVHDFDLPMVEWVCDNCGEPYNSRTAPDQHMCTACQSETTWHLPEDVEQEYAERLFDAEEGDTVLVVPEHAAAMQGEVSRSFVDELLLDEDGDARIIDSSLLCVYTIDEYHDGMLGDRLQYVEVNS